DTTHLDTYLTGREVVTYTTARESFTCARSQAVAKKHVRELLKSLGFRNITWESASANGWAGPDAELTLVVKAFMPPRKLEALRAAAQDNEGVNGVFGPGS